MRRLAHGRTSRPPSLDALTGLLDRASLVAWLAEAISTGDRTGVALQLLRVDGLPLINGRLGRDVGDEILRRVGRRLREHAGGGAVAARLSGSWFALVRPTVEDAEVDSLAVARSLREPVHLHPATFHLTFRCVLVLTDGFHRDASQLLGEAEHVAAKRAAVGRDEVEVVRLTLADGVEDVLGGAARAAHALASGDIAAAYQPVVDLRTMEAVGVEALARWDGAPRGLEAPDAFIEVVFALGLGPDLLDRILWQVCTDFATGAAAARGWWASVNIGGDDCADPTLPGRLQAILDATGLDPSRLVLEVSERSIPDPVVDHTLRNLAELGVRIAVDDFGSGWSSLAHVRSLPISLLKIDRSLATCTTNQDVRLLIAVIALAEALGLETLAEGIERQSDALLLRATGCDYGQGFHWSRAAALDEILVAFPVLPSTSVPMQSEAIGPRPAASLGRARPAVDPESERLIERLEEALRRRARDRRARSPDRRADPGR